MTIAAIVADCRSRLSDDVESEDIGGITVAIIPNGELHWCEGIGYSDRAMGVRAGPQSVYRMGSITKCFTGVVLAHLQEEGLLEVDDLVEAHLPEVRGLMGYGDFEPISLRQLASHTGGVGDAPNEAAAGPIERWEARVLQYIPMTGYKVPPGSGFSYSNFGYAILGLALSRAAGASYIELVHDLILAPLGMTQSGFFPTAAMWRDLATGYARPWGEINQTIPYEEHWGRGFKVPNGGLYSCASDMARFIASQADVNKSSFLQRESLAEMYRIQTPESGASGYGLGFELRTGATGRLFAGHEGRVPGYNSYMEFDPQSGSGVVLMRNYLGALNLEHLGRHLLDRVIEESTSI